MNEALENIKEWCAVVENAIYQDHECPSSFEEKFCDGNELLEVAFSSTHLHVYYVLSSGEHIHNTFPLDKLNEWLEE